MVTDYDCWHADHAAVTVTDIIHNLNANAENAAKVVRGAVRNLRLEEPRTCDCSHALAHALITDPKAVPEATYRKLELLVGKYLAR